MPLMNSINFQNPLQNILGFFILFSKYSSWELFFCYINGLWLSESMCKVYFYCMPLFIIYFQTILLMCYPPQILSQKSIQITRIRSFSTRIKKYISNRLLMQDIK